MTEGPDASRVPAEARARALIDRQLGAAGWFVQDKKAMNLFAARGIAVREVTLKPGHDERTTCSISTRPSLA